MNSRTKEHRQSCWSVLAALAPLSLSRRLIGATFLAVLSACGGGSGGGASLWQQAATKYQCDDGLTSLDFGDAQSKVVSARMIAAGAPVSAVQLTPAATAAAPVDMCLVKIIVGPGNPGSADDPATSAGIGIEVLLPAKSAWNHRYIGMGNLVYAGGAAHQDPKKVSTVTSFGMGQVAQGYVISSSDDGHAGPADFSPYYSDWIMKADGKPNTALLEDWAARAPHETAVKTKALIKAYYGKGPEYSYWNGTSTGGREGLMLAQRYPRDFNGIISAVPAINWPSFAPSSVWPQVVMHQDLGGPIPAEKLIAANNASIRACDSDLTGQHDGYISDLSSCRFDPTRDTALLCTSSGGTNSTSACLSLAEARVLDKIWYGPRTDGDAVDPAVDNGWNFPRLSKGQIWYGYNRGTLLHDNPFAFGTGVAGADAFTVGADWMALTMGNPAFGSPAFTNKLGKGEDLWRTLDYAGDQSFAAVIAKSQLRFADLNATDNPDLSEFKKAGGKIIHWHGMADTQIPAGGSVHYYESVLERMGGLPAVQEFYRFYLVPGMGHGLPSDPTVRAPVPGGDTSPLFGANSGLLPILREWVENARAPNDIAAESSPSMGAVRKRLWCAYPRKLRYLGGDPDIAASFACS